MARRAARRTGFYLAAAAVMAARAALAQDIDLAAGRAAWHAAGIGSYEYSYRRVCECHPDRPADTIVTVEDGEVVAVRYARDDYAQDIPLAADRIRWFRTVDDLFGLLETAAARAAVVRASFDTALGFPRSLYIDYVTDLVGDEVDLTITRLTPAPAAAPRPAGEPNPADSGRKRD